MLKIKLQQPASTDAGSYVGMKEVPFDTDESIVEATFCNEKENSVFVSGEEMIRIGGLESCFNPNYKYMWGAFEIVE